MANYYTLEASIKETLSRNPILSKDMVKSAYIKGIREGNQYDIHHNPAVSTDKGWKLSIQGKKIDDIWFVFSSLFDFLVREYIPFKVGTTKRLACADKQQARKIMTIYVPDSMNHMELAEKVYTRIMDYKGWHEIKTPDSYEHYAGGVFFRNDRDEYGNYIISH